MVKPWPKFWQGGDDCEVVHPPVRCAVARARKGARSPVGVLSLGGSCVRRGCGFVPCGSRRLDERRARQVPAPISQVLSWECVGEGAQFNGQTTYPIYAYLVEDSYLQSQDDGVPRGAVGGRYLLFDWDATVPLAEEASRVLTALLGALLLAYGGRFFWGVERAGTPFTAESARRLKGAGGIAIAAAVVPNAVGLLISSLAQTYHLTPVGAWKIGVWNVGVTTGLTLALGVLLIALGIAFDYGVVLQQQDDELL